MEEVAVDDETGAPGPEEIAAIARRAGLELTADQVADAGLALPYLRAMIDRVRAAIAARRPAGDGR